MKPWIQVRVGFPDGAPYRLSAGEQVSVTWDKSPEETRTALLGKAMLH